MKKFMVCVSARVNLYYDVEAESEEEAEALYVKGRLVSTHFIEINKVFSTCHMGELNEKV